MSVAPESVKLLVDAGLSVVVESGGESSYLVLSFGRGFYECCCCSMFIMQVLG